MSGASKPANVLASGQVLMSGFLILLDYSPPAIDKSECDLPCAQRTMGQTQVASNHPLFDKLGEGRVSEWTNKSRGARERSEQCEASK